MTDPRPTVALLFGGRSSEHSVSCVTAAGILGAIDEEKFRVLPVGITKDGTWRLVPEAGGFSFGGELPEVVPDGSEVLPALSVGAPMRHRSAEGVLSDLGVVDVVFPVLHGPYGEDGTVQGLFELSDTRFVGSGVFSSSASMDKHYMKVVLESAGIPVAPYELVTGTQWRADADAVTARIFGLGDVVFVKPSRAGSSMGVSRVAHPSELAGAMEEALNHDDKVIVEPSVEGREVECGVLGVLGGGAEASPLGEIVVGDGHAFYDFEAKYLDGSVDLRCPTVLDPEVEQRLQDIALRTFAAFDCEGLARVDTFVQADGTVLVNELNTLPGFTPTSMYPLMWQAAGLAYPALIERLLRLALARPTGMR